MLPQVQDEMGTKSLTPRHGPRVQHRMLLVDIGKIKELHWGMLRVKGRPRGASCLGAIVFPPGSFCLSLTLVISPPNVGKLPQVRAHLHVIHICI